MSINTWGSYLNVNQHLYYIFCIDVERWIVKFRQELSKGSFNGFNMRDVIQVIVRENNCTRRLQFWNINSWRILISSVMKKWQFCFQCFQTCKILLCFCNPAEEFIYCPISVRVKAKGSSLCKDIWQLEC